MDCELLVVPDCSRATAAEVLFRAVLPDAGLPVAVDVVVIADQWSAARRGFVGSPSFFVNGHDLFPVPEAPAAVACRVYRDALGRLRGLPAEQDLSAAVRGVTRSSRSENIRE
jgi:hypothetical protein